ncbi:hypothetical protein BFP72_03555 [Reichenbachiella sp. 5M10]|nr:hypothetical protein BFP72_03555 [Reichenbachiella sp. 5M10]
MSTEVQADSWSKLEMMLDNRSVRRRPIVMWQVAASLVVLLISAVVYFAVVTDDQLAFEHGLEELRPKTVVSSQIVPLQPAQVRLVPVVVNPPVAQQVVASVPKRVQMEPQRVEAKSLDTPMIEESETVAKVPVKITYKRSADSTPEDMPIVSKSKVKELIHQAQELEAGNVWADIREAKNKALQNPFGLQKERQKLK